MKKIITSSSTGFLFSHLEVIVTGVKVEQESLTLITLGDDYVSIYFALKISCSSGMWTIALESVIMFVSSKISVPTIFLLQSFPMSMVKYGSSVLALYISCYTIHVLTVKIKI